MLRQGLGAALRNHIFEYPWIVGLTSIPTFCIIYHFKFYITFLDKCRARKELEMERIGL